MDEQAFNARIAQRLGHSAPPPLPAWQAPVLQPPNLPAAGDWEALATRFVAELTQLNAGAERVATAAAVRPAVLAALQKVEARRVAVWRDPLLAACGLLDLPGVETLIWDEALGEPELRRLAAACDAGITGADAGVAETGSLLYTPAPGRGRMAGVLPWLHVSVLPVERLLPSVPDLFRWLSRQAAAGAFPGGPGMPSMAGINTGPSRTADIQSKLVLGAHGPGAIHAVLVG